MKRLIEMIAGIGTLAKIMWMLMTDKEEMRQYNYDYNGGEE